MAAHSLQSTRGTTHQSKEFGSQAPVRRSHAPSRSRALSWLIAVVLSAANACGAIPVITSSGAAAGTLNAAFTYQITATDSPESYSATGLPSGLSVNASTGLISGLPTQTGAFTSTINAINASGSGSATLTIRVQTVVDWPAQGNIPSTLTNVAAIAGGAGGHAVALKSDGTVVAWGYDAAATKVPVGLNSVVAVACGVSYSLALKADGTVVGWGGNASGQSTPPASVNNAVAIAAGHFHNLALKSDGTVVAWGLETFNNTVVPAGLSNVIAVAAGYHHSLALRSDGTVVAWGVPSGAPEVPDGLNNVVAIAAAGRHSLALKSDGTVVGWGGNNSGQTTVPVGLNDVIAIACGDNHSVALRSDRTVVAWGYNGSGQANVPPNLANVVAIGNTRGEFSLALTGDESSTSPPAIISRLRILGGMHPFQYRIVARNTPTDYNATGLPAGLSVNRSTGVITGTPTQSGTFNIAITATNPNGTSAATLVLTVLPTEPPVIASGLIANSTVNLPFSYQIAATNLPTSYGAAGLPAGLSIDSTNGLISGTLTQPGPFNVTITATNTSGTGSATLTIFSQTLVGWGSNPENETTIPAGLSNVIAIDADSYSSLALRANGTVIAWGWNDFNKGNVPAALTDVIAISNGGGHSLALRSNGTVAAWGSNVWRQSTVPAGLTNVVAISAGWLHNLALKSDGSVVGWGATPESLIPAGLEGVVAIAAGKAHSLALRADGTVLWWGDYDDPDEAVVPPGLSNVVAIASGANHSLALKGDGTVVAWGSDWAGQASVPSGLNNVIAISAGVVHSMALKSDGSVVAWGAETFDYQNEGQATVPPGLENVVAIAAGDVHSLALIGNESTTALPVIISPIKKLGAFYPFQYRIIAKNAPTSYDATGLPGGLSVDPTTGLISGTPTQVGTFNTLISATNPNGTTSVNVAITILPFPSTITGPVGGTLTLSPVSPVRPGAPLVARASGWTDREAPLTYQFLVDDVALTAASSATTVSFVAPSAVGAHVVKVRVSDALGNFSELTLTLIVNNPPEARALTVHAQSGPGGFNLIDVAPVISDADGDELVISSVTPGAHGEVNYFKGTMLRFVTDESFTGNDVFTYTISDGRGGAATASITLHNAAPIATDDSVHPTSGVLLLDVLHLGTPDRDVDGDALNIIAVTHGTSGTTATDGSIITYTPGAGYDGNDSFSYTISDSRGAFDTATVRLRNTRPIVAGDLLITNGESVTFDPRLNDADADNDSLQVTAVSRGGSGVAVNGGSTITYTPGPGFFGRDAFTYTVSDATSSATGTVTVRSSKPLTLAGLTKGEPVPEQPEGVVYESFGSSAYEVYSGKLRGPRGPAKRALFSKDGVVLLAIGSDAPGLAGATIRALGEPSGNAVVATLRASGTAAADERALILGLHDGDLRVGLLEGDPLPGALKVKSFVTMDGNGDCVFLLAKLAGVGVTSATDVALLAILPDGSVKMLVREGDVVNGQPIAVLASLISVAGTTAEARWRSSNDGIGVRLTFSNKRQALYTIPATASGPADWVGWAETGDLLALAGPTRSFGLPGFGNDGVAFTAQLEPTSDEQINVTNDTVVFRATASGRRQLAREGDLVTGPDGAEFMGVRYKRFGDPIAGPDGRTAFAALLEGEGVIASNRSGLWLGESDGTVRELARTGALAPGGGRWTVFESLVFPDGPQSGPIFSGTLALSAVDEVTRRNRRGLWAVDSAGMLQLLLRTGDSVSVNGVTHVVKSFAALNGASGSLGAARGYDNDQHVTVVVTFADGKQAIVNIAVP